MRGCAATLAPHPCPPRGSRCISDNQAQTRAGGRAGREKWDAGGPAGARPRAGTPPPRHPQACKMPMRHVSAHACGNRPTTPPEKCRAGTDQEAACGGVRACERDTMGRHLPPPRRAGRRPRPRTLVARPGLRPQPLPPDGGAQRRRPPRGGGDDAEHRRDEQHGGGRAPCRVQLQRPCRQGLTRACPATNHSSLLSSRPSLSSRHICLLPVPPCLHPPARAKRASTAS